MPVPVRTYRMTVWAGISYNLGEEGAKSIESHYVAALPGDIREARQDLADFGIEDFRRIFEGRRGYKPPLAAVKVSFEAEERALAPSLEVHVETLEMVYRGRQHYANRFPPRVLTYDIEYDPEFADEQPEDEDEEPEDDEDYEDDEEW
jgi:hypothetical protein